MVYALYILENIKGSLIINHVNNVHIYFKHCSNIEVLRWRRGASHYRRDNRLADEGARTVDGFGHS